MTPNAHGKKVGSGSDAEKGGIRPGVRLVVALVLVGCIGVSLAVWLRKPAPSAAPDSKPAEASAPATGDSAPFAEQRDETLPVQVSNQPAAPVAEQRTSIGQRTAPAPAASAAVPPRP